MHMNIDKQRQRAPAVTVQRAVVEFARSRFESPPGNAPDLPLDLLHEAASLLQELAPHDGDAEDARRAVASEFLTRLELLHVDDSARMCEALRFAQNYLNKHLGTSKNSSFPRPVRI
jgi:hypothetical protein